jgi:hypothetical protein
MAALVQLGSSPDEEGIARFQRANALESTGVLDWQTILVLDAISAPAARPRLSSY